jgi:hypothetical protein
MGGEWSASRSGRFTPRRGWIGGWVGPRAGLGAVEKRKIFYLCRESNPDRPAGEGNTNGIKLHNEELHNSYSASNIAAGIKGMRRPGHVRVLNPQGKRPL